MKRVESITVPSEPEATEIIREFRATVYPFQTEDVSDIQTESMTVTTPDLQKSLPLNIKIPAE